MVRVPPSANSPAISAPGLARLRALALAAAVSFASSGPMPALADGDLESFAARIKANVEKKAPE